MLLDYRLCCSDLVLSVVCSESIALYGLYLGDATMTFAHLFSGSVQALKYGQYRPSYPKELYTNIFDFSGEGSRQLAVDIATGTGQAAVELAGMVSCCQGPTSADALVNLG